MNALRCGKYITEFARRLYHKFLCDSRIIPPPVGALSLFRQVTSIGITTTTFPLLARQCFQGINHFPPIIDDFLHLTQTEIQELSV